MSSRYLLLVICLPSIALQFQSRCYHNFEASLFAIDKNIEKSAESKCTHSLGNLIMNIPPGSTELTPPIQDTKTWQHLKQVIANSSGFERWQKSRKLVNDLKGDEPLNDLVLRYLRETLETLAY
jgi:hypothetical protein